jgi:hypothetical protein
MKPIDYLRNAIGANQPAQPQSQTMMAQQQQNQQARKVALAQNKQAVLNTLSNPQQGAM